MSVRLVVSLSSVPVDSAQLGTMECALQLNFTCLMTPERERTVRGTVFRLTLITGSNKVKTVHHTRALILRFYGHIQDNLHLQYSSEEPEAVRVKFNCPYVLADSS